MTISLTSLQGRSSAQVSNLRDMNIQLNELQRQIGTQKKTDTYSGLGTDTTRVQRLRADVNSAEIYMKNITFTETKMKIMSNTMLSITDQARDVTQNIQLQTRDGEIDLHALQTIAGEALNAIMDMLNIDNDGNHLFAGTDLNNQPIADSNAVHLNTQAEIANWLAGGQSPTDVVTNVNGFSEAELGYSASINAAGDVITRIDTNLEVNFTQLGNAEGFQDIIKGLSIAANLEYPDPAVDVATDEEFHDLLDQTLTLISGGIQKTDSDNAVLTGKFNLLKSVEERHQQDTFVFGEMISEIEDVDTTQVIAEFQALQNQMNAAYEVTSVIGRLSLVNFL